MPEAGYGDGNPQGAGPLTCIHVFWILFCIVPGLIACRIFWVRSGWLMGLLSGVGGILIMTGILQLMIWFVHRDRGGGGRAQGG